DRQPEFTQIDVETSFLDEEEIRAMFEAMIRSTVQHAIGVELPAFPVMRWQEAMRRFGSDKPDLRVKLELTELTDVMTDVDFKVFSTPARTQGGRVAALRVPSGGEMSRSEPEGRPRGLAGDRSRALHRQGLRRRPERPRARRRLGPDPSRGRAEQGLSRAQDRRRGGARQVRLPARRAAIWRAAPRRHRHRP